MDRSISATTENRLFGSAWKDSIEILKEAKEKIPTVNKIEICLPYIAYKEYSKSDLKFLYIETEKEYNKINKINPYKIFYTNLFLREGYKKQIFGAELTADAEVVPQFYKRARGYSYIWDKHELTIRVMLATYEYKKIDKILKDLLNNYKRFYWMYCKTK